MKKRFSDFDNVEPQLDIIDELVSQGINGLALTPVNNPRISEKLLSLHNMGIPVVAVNSEIDNSEAHRICRQQSYEKRRNCRWIDEINEK